MGDLFRDKFRTLTGNDPFPWQARLFHALAANEPPEQLDIPTGLGKTSVIPIWLLAHLLSKSEYRPPMRLVYVVNRRTIVDQASSIAENLWKKIIETPEILQLWSAKFDSRREASEQKKNGFTAASNILAVSTLRGALADNREWMQYPHRPAIIVGTVDMIGSRLLFDAYRSGKWSKAMHAGLLGHDSILVHDEAHLTKPFQKLLEWVVKQQDAPRNRTSPLRTMKLLAMSATGESGEKKTLSLDEKDFALGAVKARIHSTKRLKLHPSAGKGKVVEELVALAGAYAGAAKKIIIFVREPKTAKAVVEGLRSGHDVPADRIELLTGTLRGYERDELVKTRVLQSLLGTSAEPVDNSLFLVSTSAGEVGADFDADHLICDLTPLDSMIQRLGRVNRKGLTDSNVDVVFDLKASDKLSPFETAAVRAGDWLGELPVIENDMEERRNASPDALRAQRTKNAKAYQDGCSPPLETVTPHAATLDAWALTSIQEEWPLAPKLDDYLHGLKDYEPPRTSLAWREELSIFFPFSDKQSLLDDSAAAESREQAAERREQFKKWIDLCTLHPRELVNERSDRVIAVLVAIAARYPYAPLVRLDRKEVIVEPLIKYTNQYTVLIDKKRQQDFCRDMSNQSFILPAEIGGLSHGLLDEKASASVDDVADAVEKKNAAMSAEDEPPLPRLRVWLGADEDNNLTPRILGKTPASLETLTAPADTSKWNLWRDRITQLLTDSKHRMKQVYQQRFTVDDKPVGVLLLFKPQLIEPASEERVPLDEHNADAAQIARNFGQPLGLPEACVQAIQIAAGWHDLGKDRERWQNSIKNKRESDPDNYVPLAKSFGKGMDIASLGGYRHEFGSLIDAIDPEKGKDRPQQWADVPPELHDLVLHLVAAHHGRGRPSFPDGVFDPDNVATKNFDQKISPAEIARRYARLQRAYGHWGLAYLESLVMCADHAASRGEEPEDTQ